MQLRTHLKHWCMWLLCFNAFLDMNWDWRAPWNWHPRSELGFACGSEDGLAAESNRSSHVKVIFASVGQSGTTSVCDAVRALGLRTYHIEEQLLFTRRALADGATASTWARCMSRCRVEAVALEPFTDLLPAALEASPGAKVILTWRDYPSWRDSSQTRGGLRDVRWQLIMSRFLSSSLRMLPWISLWDAMTGQVTKMLLNGKPFAGAGEADTLEMLSFFAFGRHGLGIPDNLYFFRGTNKVNLLFGSSEEAYLAHMEEIVRLVPEHRLLIFDVRKQGWSELTEFLGLPLPPAGTPLPRPRSARSFTNDTVWDNSSLKKRLTVVCVSLMLHVVNYALLRAGVRSVRGMWRRGWSARGKAD